MNVLIGLLNHLPTMGDFGRYVLLALGLGFVVFFHELGHFLAAKYCGVRVDQFAIGFGSAIVSWRKGIGFRRGTTVPYVERRLEQYRQEHTPNGESGETHLTSEQTQHALAAMGIDETEYRLNWVPLGGYVKMLGQDDMVPDTLSDDPRSFNNKPIRSRMLIVSAGVLMNVLLAGIGFMLVYLIGLHSAPAEVGGILANSPASFAVDSDGKRAPLEVGDRILSLDGKSQQDFGKLALTVALVKEGESIPMVVLRRDGREETLHVTPARSGEGPTGLLSLGVMQPLELRGPDSTEKIPAELIDPKFAPAEMSELQPGDVITAINGQAVAAAKDDYWMLDQAARDSDGKPVELTVQSIDGKTRTISVEPHFASPFSADVDLNLAGMTPRSRIDELTEDSPAKGQILPGDAVAAIMVTATHTVVENPAPKAFRDAVNAAGQANQAIQLTVVDASGKTRTTSPIVPDVSLANDRKGLSVIPGADEQNAVVAAVVAGSAADKAGVKPGWRITSIAGEPVSNWFQVRKIISEQAAGDSVPLVAVAPAGPMTVNLTLSSDEIESAKYLPFTTDLSAMLHERDVLRRTHNPIVAARWGAAETRDFILQFYVTIHRMVSGSVSYKQTMGPVGIIQFGAMSAARGMDWLIWFLAMISADLAVVNFIPLPVMDGGLFVLLIVEAIQGRSLSLRTQQMIQTVGLAILLSIFLLVTYQDVARLFGHG